MKSSGNGEKREERGKTERGRERKDLGGKKAGMVGGGGGGRQSKKRPKREREVEV